jgi:phosphoglycolate phosphatase-like HAD superfamily hydrolase
MQQILDPDRGVRGLSVRQCHAVFDAESLLLDPSRGVRHSLRCALHDVGRKLPADAFRHWSLRTPLREACAILLECRDAELLTQACERYFHHYDETGRYLCTLRPGSLRLLAELAVQRRMELHYLTHIGIEAAARLLDVYGLRHFPRSVVTPEQPLLPGVRLPLLQHLVESSEEPPSSWLLLSDHPCELLAAQRLHLRSIALGYGRAPLPTLCALRPGAIAASVSDVGSCLGQVGGLSPVRAPGDQHVH